LERNKQNTEAEQWLTRQNFKLLGTDDLFAVWSTGQKAGVYALGKVITNPSKNPLRLTTNNEQNFRINRKKLKTMAPGKGFEPLRARSPPAILPFLAKPTFQFRSRGWRDNHSATPAATE
jgi:hypothetical protein